MIVTVRQQLISLDQTTFAEHFSYDPHIQILEDDHRWVCTFIRLLMMKMSIAETYRVIDLQYFSHGQVRLIMEKNDCIPPFRERTIQFEYLPYMGTRKCSKCMYFRKQGKHEWCYIRGCRLKAPEWKNCVYYVENSLVSSTNDSRPATERDTIQREGLHES